MSRLTPRWYVAAKVHVEDAHPHYSGWTSAVIRYRSRYDARRQFEALAASSLAEVVEAMDIRVFRAPVEAELRWGTTGHEHGHTTIGRS